MIFASQLPQGQYDFIANLPEGSAAALQQEVKRKFGLVGRRETRETDVLLLTVKHPGAEGLRPTQSRNSTANSKAGQFFIVNQPVSALADFLELYFETPVLDQTGLTDRFDIDLKWDERDGQHRNPDSLKQVLLDQLGLELAPGREPVEMLVVEKG